jgi:hypothetical protein
MFPEFTVSFPLEIPQGANCQESHHPFEEEELFSLETFPVRGRSTKHMIPGEAIHGG